MQENRPRRLAAGLAHDFKNVLNVMSLWSAVLLRSSEVDKAVAEKAIADAEQQGRALTRQLVVLARPGARSVTNLVLNARDAMPTGGSIVVGAGLHTASGTIDLVDGSLAAGRWAVLSVSDTGTGIDPAIRERIFDIFFTTKGPERGTGLGLATVLRIARGTGGGVALETEVGRGATFRIYLPAA